MKKYLIAIFFLLMSALPAEAITTNAISLVDPAPAYDACNGSFVESLTVIPCQVLVYSSDVILQDQIIDTIPCQVLVYSSDIALNEHVFTNAVVGIDPAPAYNACNGSFVESLTVIPCQVLIYSAAESEWNCLSCLNTAPCQVLIKCERIGSAMKWAQFRSWAQGRSWGGNPGLEFKSSGGGAAMMGQE